MCVIRRYIWYIDYMNKNADIVVLLS